MSNKVSGKGKQFFNTFIDEYEKSKKTGIMDFSASDKIFNDYVTEKTSVLVFEDHQRKMNEKELTSHLKMLFKKCEDKKTEDKFLKTVGKSLDMDECTEKDLKNCAEKLVEKDEDEADKIIHKLEDMVGHEYEEDDDEKDKDDD